MPAVMERPPRPPRSETREVVELKQIKAEQPDLTPAVDMQLALVEMQRRVQLRVPLARLQVDPDWLRAQHAAARPAIRFADIPLEWTDFRLTFRQTADILLRFEALERVDHEKIVALSRDGHALEPLVTGWYETTSGINGAKRAYTPAAGDPAGVDQVMMLAMRPFLARAVESLRQHVDLGAWQHGHCLFCGWEPDFAVITPSGDRQLICGRCAGQWSFAPLTCPYCANDDRRRITSFATRDGRYRVYGCDECRRYLKAYDARNAARSVLVAVDSIATLPLDAAAMQRGYIA
jgi:Protein involved in formate dehydrogenase formation